jgi:ribosome-associated protein
MITLIEDTRQKKDLHKVKHDYWDEEGRNIIRCALPFGDYISAPKIAVDTKQNISEIGMNMCGAGREKHRFTEECKKAKEANCKLIFLIEDERYSSIEDLYGKSIYLFSGRTIPGDQLATAMFTMQNRYGCEFWFCPPEEAARIIAEILE